MQEPRSIGIYGAGGFAREVDWLASTLEGYDLCHCVAYIQDEAPEDGELRGKPILTLERFIALYPEAAITAAVGNPQSREAIVSRCLEAGRSFITLVAQSAELSDSVRIGNGTIICAGCILTVDIELGAHVHINLDCTVGHDVVMEDFVTLAPGVHVSGNVRIERGAYIGTGANIINGQPGKPLVIGARSVIGAGACITQSCEPGCLYAGVPAVLKKRY